MDVPEFRHPSFFGRIGVAQQEITPPVGVYSRCWGAASHDVGKAVHRPLTLTALTISNPDDDSPLVLICTDAPGWRELSSLPDFFSRLRSELSLSPERLILALSHTHAAPVLAPSKTPMDVPGGDLLHQWTQSLPEHIVKTVRTALERSTDATIDWSTGRCTLATNRDFRDPDSTRNRFLCGFSPDTKADDTLLVGRVTDSTGQTLATLVNYACHPTTLAWENESISPDYIGGAREIVEEATQAPMLFLLGACGELAPRYQYTGETDVADQHGRQLGYAVLSTLYGMEPPGTKLTYSGVMESGAPLALWSRTANISSTTLRASRTEVEVPLKDWPSTEELRQAFAECNDRALKERIRRKLGIRQAFGDGKTYPLEIFSWQVGDAILVGTRGEAYSIFQQQLRDRFPDHAVVCMNLVNGSIGYLPPADCYDEDLYTVWQTPLDRGSLERTQAAAEEAIQRLISTGEA